jgi:CRISPR-associated protein Csd1
MILQALNDLYARLANDQAYRVAPFGYSLQKISFRVVLHGDGRLFEIQDSRKIVDGKPRPRQLLVPGDAKPSGAGINPCFLWDNGSYLLGFKADDPKPERTAMSFAAFRDRHLSLRHEIECDELAAVCRFLESWRPEHAPEHPVLAEVGAGFGVFQIVGTTAYVHEHPAVKAWWSRQVDSGTATPTAQCLITGEELPVAVTHPKIKGVRGAQSAGAVIVGFNETAYESYGKSQSANAPVSVPAAFQYTTAVNALLDGPKRDRHRISLADATVVFWTDRPTITESFFAQLANFGADIPEDAAQDEDLRKQLEVFLRALRHGVERAGELGSELDTGFYLLGLAPNAARISVRLFYRSTVAELLANLRRHFDDIRVVGSPKTDKHRGDPEFPPAWLLLRQTARDPSEIPPLLSGPFLRSIISGGHYPQGLYSAVIRRIRLDSTINFARACVIKGFLIRNRKQEVSMALDRDRTDPAYCLGRLFAALEKTQTDALGNKINTTIRDRFYSSASANPGAVFPRLLRTYQHHLAKLERSWAINREKLVQEVLAPLEGFPAQLDLTEQGVFAIGYYHQKQDLYTKKGSEASQEAEEGDKE